MKILIIMLLSINLFAEDIVIKNINSVYDGDTFKVDLNCDIKLLCNDIPVRVLGIDTPEIRGTTGNVKSQSLEAKRVTTEFLGSGKITLEDCKRDKFFRLLCKVKKGETYLSDVLIQRNLAKPYFGGTKEIFE